MPSQSTHALKPPSANTSLSYEVPIGARIGDEEVSVTLAAGSVRRWLVGGMSGLLSIRFHCGSIEALEGTAAGGEWPRDF